MSLAKHSSLIMHVASTPLHVGYHVDEAQKSQPPPFACVPLRSYALLGCAALSSGQDWMKIGYVEVLGKAPNSWGVGVGSFDVG